MPTEEIVMRGQTAGAETSPPTKANQEVLNFGMKDGYAFKLIEFVLYPSTGIGSNNDEMMGTITAGKTSVDPSVPNFNDEGLIGVAYASQYSSPAYPPGDRTIVNDTFLISQNLILTVLNTDAATPVNWQCRFKPVKLSDNEQANVNYRQFSVFDE